MWLLPRISFNYWSSLMTDPTIEQRRDDYLQWLYKQSGRTCGTFTGLYQQRIAELIERDMQEALGE